MSGSGFVTTVSTPKTNALHSSTLSRPNLQRSAQTTTCRVPISYALPVPHVSPLSENLELITLPPGMEAMGSGPGAVESIMVTTPALDANGNISTPSNNNTEQAGADDIYKWDINDASLPLSAVAERYRDWPDNHCKHVYLHGCEEARRHASGWAMRNTNNHNVNILKKSCLGVLTCSHRCILPDGSTVHLRPAICDKARKKQLGRPCTNHDICGGILVLTACHGHCGYPVTHFWRHYGGLVFFQAKGIHDHPRPDIKHSSLRNKRKLSQNGSGRRRKIFKADSVEAHGDCEDCQPKTSTNYNLRQQRLSQAHPSVQTGSSDAEYCLSYSSLKPDGRDRPRGQKTHEPSHTGFQHTSRPMRTDNNGLIPIWPAATSTITRERDKISNQGCLSVQSDYQPLSAETRQYQSVMSRNPAHHVNTARLATEMHQYRSTIESDNSSTISFLRESSMHSSMLNMWPTGADLRTAQARLLELAGSEHNSKSIFVIQPHGSASYSLCGHNVLPTMDTTLPVLQPQTNFPFAYRPSEEVPIFRPQYTSYTAVNKQLDCTYFEANERPITIAALPTDNTTSVQDHHTATNCSCSMFGADLHQHACDSLSLFHSHSSRVLPEFAPHMYNYDNQGGRYNCHGNMSTNRAAAPGAWTYPPPIYRAAEGGVSGSLSPPHLCGSYHTSNMDINNVAGDHVYDEATAEAIMTAPMIDNMHFVATNNEDSYLTTQTMPNDITTMSQTRQETQSIQVRSKDNEEEFRDADDDMAMNYECTNLLGLPSINSFLCEEGALHHNQQQDYNHQQDDLQSKEVNEYYNTNSNLISANTDNNTQSPMESSEGHDEGMSQHNQTHHASHVHIPADLSSAEDGIDEEPLSYSFRLLSGASDSHWLDQCNQDHIVSIQPISPEQGESKWDTSDSKKEDLTP